MTQPGIEHKSTGQLATLYPLGQWAGQIILIRCEAQSTPEKKEEEIQGMTLNYI